MARAALGSAFASTGRVGSVTSRAPSPLSRALSSVCKNLETAPPGASEYTTANSLPSRAASARQSDSNEATATATGFCFEIKRAAKCGPGASARANASGAAYGVPVREIGSSPRNAVAVGSFFETDRGTFLGTRPPRGGCGWKKTATRALAFGFVGSAGGTMTFFSATARGPNRATPNVRSIHLGKK